jgi:hypothetical protein
MTPDASWLVRFVHEQIRTVNITPYGGPRVEGLTSDKVRHLLRLLCWRPVNYLEVGLYTGGTFFAATQDNPHLSYATGIDNWCYQDKGPVFMGHLATVMDRMPPHTIHQEDCWKVPFDQIPHPIDVYFYDAAHKAQASRRSVTHFWPILRKPSIILVDDWDAPKGPKEGTRAGLAEVGANVWAEWALSGPRTPKKNKNEWWQGLFVAVVD